MTPTRKERRPKRTTILLDDLAPRKDVRGGGATKVFGEATDLGERSDEPRKQATARDKERRQG